MQINSKLNIAQFNSVQEAGKYFQDIRLPEREMRASFSGSTSHSQALRMCMTGDTSRVAEAEKLMRQFEVECDDIMQTYDLSVSGMMPIIPAYLAGDPECMLDMVDVTSHAPITLIMELSARSSVTHSELTTRGIAALALAMKLCEQRPVTLKIMWFSEGRLNERGDEITAVTTTINTAPLDLASACFAMCDAAFFRRLNIGYGIYRTGYSGATFGILDGVRKDLVAYDSKKYIEALRFYSDTDENDILIHIPPAYSDKSDIVRNPALWIASHLKKLGF